jgi:hypothetical protein
MVHGAYTAQRALEAGVLDELQIHQIPVLFGAGRWLFELLPSRIELEIVRVIDTPEATHIRYRVRNSPGIHLGSRVTEVCRRVGRHLLGHDWSAETPNIETPPCSSSIIGTRLHIAYRSRSSKRPAAAKTGGPTESLRHEPEPHSSCRFLQGHP